MTSVKRRLLLRRIKSVCYYLISTVLSVLNNVKRYYFTEPNKTFNRILLISTPHIGDLILASSIIRALSMMYPGIIFDVVVDPENREIASLLHNVRNVLTFNYNRARGAGLPVGGLDRSNLKNVLKEVGRNEYDVLIVLFPDTILNLLVQIFFLFKKRPIKICDISWLNSFYILTGGAKKKHPLDVFKQVIAPLVDNGKIPELIPFIEIPEANKSQSKPHLNDKLIIGFCIGAGWKYRKWNKVHYLSLANLILQGYKNALIMVYGYDSEDAEAANFIKNNCKCPERVEIFPRRGMMDFLKSLQLCNLVISNDSGPAHISSALAIPVLVIFGPQTPDRALPRGFSTVKAYWKKMECNPCDQVVCFNPVKQKCMNSVLPTEVFEGVKEIVQSM